MFVAMMQESIKVSHFGLTIGKEWNCIPAMFYVIGQMVLCNLVQSVGVCRCYLAHIISWFHCV